MMMSKAFVVLWMVFFHIVDDYYLQGWLASAKQKEWWGKNAPQPLYKYDYIWALLMHGFSWSFMVMFPIAYTLSFEIDVGFVFCFVVNAITHAFVDNAKANGKYINLWCDQICHLLQIGMIATVFL